MAKAHQEKHPGQKQPREEHDSQNINFLGEFLESSRFCFIFGNPEKYEQDSEERQRKVHREDHPPATEACEYSAEGRSDRHGGECAHRENAKRHARFDRSCLCRPVAQNSHRRWIGRRRADSQENAHPDQCAKTGRKCSRHASQSNEIETREEHTARTEAVSQAPHRWLGDGARNIEPSDKQPSLGNSRLKVPRDCHQGRRDHRRVHGIQHRSQAERSHETESERSLG